MKRNSMFFLSPDDGGGTATADMPSIGSVFSAELSKLNTPPAAPVEKAAPETPAEPKKETAKPVEKTAEKKSALDVAIGGEKTEAKVDEPVVEEDPLKEFAGDAKEKNWKGLRGVAEKALADLKELQAKASTPDPSIVAEVESLKTTLAEREKALSERESKLAEYNDAMTAVNLELHPDFRREFIDGRKSLVADAAAKFKTYDGDPEQLAEAFSMPAGRRRDQAIEDLIGDLSDTAKGKITRLAGEIESLDERRDKAMQDSQQSYETLERKTVAQRQQAAQEADRIRTAEFERITRDLQKTVPTLALVDDTASDGKQWNDDLKADIGEAMKSLSPDATFPSIVAIATKGARYDRVVGMLTERLTAERKESAALKAQLAEFDSSQPDFSGRRGAKKTSADASMEKTPGQVYAETMAGLASEG